MPFLRDWLFFRAIFVSHFTIFPLELILILKGPRRYQSLAFPLPPLLAGYFCFIFFPMKPYAT